MNVLKHPIDYVSLISNG